MSGQPVQWVQANPKKSMGIFTGVIVFFIMVIIIMSLVWAFAYQQNSSEDEDKDQEIVGTVARGEKCVSKPKKASEKCVKGLSCIEGVCGVGTEGGGGSSSTGGTNSGGGGSSSTGGTNSGGDSKYKSCPTILTGASCEWKDYENLKDGICFAKYRETSSGNCGKSEAQAQCAQFGTWKEDSSSYLCQQREGLTSSIPAVGGAPATNNTTGAANPPTLQFNPEPCVVPDLLTNPTTNCTWFKLPDDSTSCGTIKSGACNATVAKTHCKKNFVASGNPNEFICSNSKVGQPCNIGGITIGNYKWKNDTVCSVLRSEQKEFDACCNATSDGFCEATFAGYSPSEAEAWVNDCRRRTSGKNVNEPCNNNSDCKSNICFNIGGVIGKVCR